MHRRYGLLSLLTAAIIFAGAYTSLMAFRPAGLPFDVSVENAHTAVVEPVANIPLPQALRVGDRLDLAALSRSARIAVSIMHLSNYSFPLGQSYEFVIHREAVPVTVSVTTVDLGTISNAWWFEWTTLSFILLLGVIALLVLWRGRDRAAAGMALWAIAFLVGLAFQHAQLSGLLGLSAWLGANVLYLIARCGFYIMIESMLGPSLTPRAQWLWRGSFLLLLAAGAVTRLGGPGLFVATGWAELLRPQYGVVFSASYLVPLALLIKSYGYAIGAMRLRLRWALWSGVIFVVNIFLNNTAVLGSQVSSVVTNSALVLSLSGFLYAVLRHRVVDVSFVLNRALVYAATTSLVLGLFALFESLIERSALGHGASLALEFAVPLALGAALSTVHRRIDAVVERFFFRRQYRAEAALRRFAEDCAYITQPENLFELTVDQIARHVGAPRVALYERTAEAYVCIRQQGEPALPAQVAVDDLAFVGLRARNAALDLHATPSALGADGYAFPLMLRGSLLGALIVGQRPGEHYAADERELLFHVAHEVGAALFALRAQGSEARVLESEAKAEASEARARSSETLLMETLRAVGSIART
ncbi:MAG: hypothetical protein KGI40_00970 [Xanthomonadaceae bacterium]|nr:hypothetical protein [Xanthomonadaceae bacterium]MDE1957646.1 hypothetical protein [Xanthomonadaceae bacterium]MDE2177618.1 hypothetical protein [Xanthomonadaceae bacterium]MDE2246011.1 hypothetical protein [Xanthomonadaceae bacterium]